MDWLKPAILSTFISSLILLLFYLYLFFRLEKNRTFRFWIIGWSFYSLRFFFKYLEVINTETTFPLTQVSMICSLFSGVFLFQGAFHLFKQRASSLAYITGAILLVWVMIAYKSFDNYDYITFPVYLFFGAVFMYSGVLFYRKTNPKTFESNLIAILFILWGLHKLDYPFLINNENLASLGYSISTIFAILVALSIGLFYIQQTSGQLKENEISLKKTNDEIKRNNEQLECLLNISKINTHSTEHLVTEALSEAINLTNSKIGYIYYYNEETKLFTLNAWSDSAMKECKIVEKQTIYPLDKTGCWGEAVRQRKPIMINEYEAPNKYKKGLPKGHVVLKKFLSVPVFEDEKLVAVIGVANKEIDYDTTDIKQLTLLMDNVWRISEKIRLITDLEKALKKAKEGDQLKSAFLQNLSHEIRTPMNGIVGFADILKTNNLSREKFEFYLDIIISSSNQLLSVVNDIIAISALETKQEKLINERTNLNKITNSLVETLKDSAREKDISMHLMNGFRNGDDTIITDGPKLTQILNNLISNAIKYTHEGSIYISYQLEKDNLQFNVRDTGIGIEPALHNKIFERFRQADTGPNREYGGSGLGLSISKGLIELFGGEIWLESEVNKGSTFYFTIPYKPTEKVSITKDKQIEAGDIQKKILVAEDEMVNYMYIEELFTGTNIAIIHAENGKEAVKLCMNDPEISLVLMDIKMPEMDGYTATKKIKAFRSDLTVIAQTAYALDVEIKKYEDVFDGYITKPIEKENLFQIINKTVTMTT